MLTRLLYAGEHTNPNGTKYLRARWYNPGTGTDNRLDTYAGNTSDPISLHKYLYANGNPVMGVDPSGRFTVVGLSAANGLRTTLTDVISGIGFDAQNVATGLQTGASVNQLLLANFAGSLLGLAAPAAAPLIAAGLGFGLKGARVIFNKVSGELFENFVRTRFAKDLLGEVIIKTKRLGVIGAGFDFAPVSGSSRSAQLIINEVKNVKRLKLSSFTALGSNRTSTFNNNLNGLIRAIDNAPGLDDLTKQTLRNKVRNQYISIRILFNDDKLTGAQHGLISAI